MCVSVQITGDSEKRYIIKKNEGETIYYAAEKSSSFQRLCFGSRRYFEMTLYDRTQQIAFSFRRRLACGACSFWCYLQVNLKKKLIRKKYLPFRF